MQNLNSSILTNSAQFTSELARLQFLKVDFEVRNTINLNSVIFMSIMTRFQFFTHKYREKSVKSVKI